MEIQVNGERREVPEGATVGHLLDRLELDPRVVVVERNREILRGEDRDARVLEPGDEIEIVQFVGGG